MEYSVKLFDRMIKELRRQNLQLFLVTFFFAGNLNVSSVLFLQFGSSENPKKVIQEKPH